MKQALKMAAMLGLSAWLGSACGQEELNAQDSDGSALCEEAARHRAACMGEYITPPICDEAEQSRAEQLLSVSCEEMEEQFVASGKADGAFCDWFGAGCSPDEQIFFGATCANDLQCGEGFCVEEHCFDGVSSPDFQRALDVWTETEEIEGGITQLQPINSEVRELRRYLVESAAESVHFSAFLIADDAAGAEMVEMFSAAARRGVDVRVLIDASTQYTFGSYETLDQMAEAGVKILAFNGATDWTSLRIFHELSVNDRKHEKLLIVDGRYAVMGGRNVADDYLFDGKWRDTDVYVQGAGVQGIQRMYLEIWERDSSLEIEAGCPNADSYGYHCPDESDTSIASDLRYYPAVEVEGPSKTRAIYSDPLHQETPHGYLATIALVRAARHSITISNSYFVPPRRLRKHLRAAAARGVDVRVLTNSLESTDAWWMYYASINYYAELMDAGIRIFQFNGTETMHAKTMLIDDEVAVVGSFNLDPRSAVDNSESMLLIREGAAVRELVESMAADFAYSTEATADFSLADKVKAKSMRIPEPLL